MSAIDVEKLLEAISDESPCGDDLEYDDAYLELMREATPDSGQSMLEDDAAVEPPNWREVAKAAEALFERTKDLRIAMLLTQARLHTHSMVGLADGLGLIHGLLNSYWDTVYPLLDVEDDNDPTERINSVFALGDSDGFRIDAREALLVNAPRAGKYSLRDIRVASGDLPAAEGVEPPDSGVIDAAFMEVDIDELTASADATIEASDTLKAIETHLTEQVGAQNNSLDIKLLADELKTISKIYSSQLSARGVNIESVDGDDAGQTVGGSGDIRSRDDAVRMLDKISEYFRRNEPSSPVPMLLQRAKGLISKDFMEILKDLTPDAVKQAELYSQPSDEG